MRLGAAARLIYWEVARWVRVTLNAGTEVLEDDPRWQRDQGFYEARSLKDEYFRKPPEIANIVFLQERKVWRILSTIPDSRRNVWP